MSPSRDQGDGGLPALLDYLKRARGFDFSGYKKTTLRRRIEKRMVAVGCADFSSYEEFLEVSPDEFTELFNTILINVTSFFRDGPAWEFLAEDVVPRLIQALDDDQHLRVWSAGCASGEEAYTVAMVLAEAMGEDAFKSRVKIYATDLDDEALAQARHGAYSNEALESVPADLVDKYFEPNTRGLAFRPDMRRAIIFGRNDLNVDAPISRIDLLVCRNVLMYFTPEAQARILERFNFALSPTGFLFLGKSEMLITHGNLFSPYDLKWRVFRKVLGGNLRERLAFTAPGTTDERPLRGEGVLSAAAALSPIAQVVVDHGGYLADANQRARQLFALVEGDIGRPFQDVPLSYRPADLRSAMDRAYEQHAQVDVGPVRWTDAAGAEHILEIEVAPLSGLRGEPIGASITFSDVTALSQLKDGYERAQRDLEDAYEELQSTVEELETTNEELQSTNEELETTNEELQSTNEELETMNEELKSANDELELMNIEVNTRAADLDRVNLVLEGVLSNLEVSVVVIDRNHQVHGWNAISTELWGLRADEVEGKDFMALDIGLPVKELQSGIALALAGSDGVLEQRLEAVNRRGQAFDALARIMPLRAPGGEIYGAMILVARAGDGLPPAS